MSSINLYKAFLSRQLDAGGSDTVIYVDRVTNVLGEELTTSDISNFGRGVLTVNPDADGTTAQPEFISFTGVSGNTFTGAVRGLSGKSNIETTSLKRYHPVGTPVVISVGFHNIKDVVDYVDNQIGTVTVGTSTNVDGTAGETLAAGEFVYLKNDGKWWKADASTSATSEGVQLGIAQGAGAADGAITNGVMVRGIDTNQSGLVTGTTYYLSDTAGDIGTSAGTVEKVIGVARSTTSIYFDPVYATVPTASQINAFAPTGSITLYGAVAAPTGWLLCDGSAVSRTTYSDLFAILSTSYGVGDGSTTFNVPDLKARFPLGYSASAPTKVLTFASRSSNTITVTGSSNTNNNEIQTGQAVLYTAASGAMTGLTHNTTYYLIRVAYNQFSLATSVANANAGTAISLSSDGTGAQTFTMTFSARALGAQGGEENHALTDAEMPSHNHSIYASNISTGSGNLNNLEDGGNQSSIIANSSFAGSDTPHNNIPLFTVVNYIIKT